jgi:MFS family permease
VSDLLPGYLFVGVGIAFSFVPVTIAALAGVEDREAGLGSGLINTSQQIGGAIGVALASTVFNTHIGKGPPTLKTLTDGYALSFWVLAGFGVAALVATVLLIRNEEIGEPAAAPIAG